jgi:hypothetical protein
VIALEAMSRKALLVGLEYPLDNERRLESSVNDILEFNQCLTQNLNFLPENIEILVDASATVGGQKPFDFNQVKAKLNTLVCNAKEGDVLLFVFSGHGLVRTPCLYLGCNEQGNKVYMNGKFIYLLLFVFKFYDGFNRYKDAINN